MKIRQNGGGTLALAAVLTLVLILIGLAAFFLYRIEGGNREFKTAAWLGNLAVARRAVRDPFVMLDIGRFPEDRNFLGDVNPDSTVATNVFGRMAGHVAMSQLNVIAAGSLPTGVANVQRLCNRLQGLRNSHGAGLNTRLVTLGTDRPQWFTSLANTTGMLGPGMGQGDYNVAYLPGAANVAMGSQAVTNRQMPYIDFIGNRRVTLPADFVTRRENGDRYLTGGRRLSGFAGIVPPSLEVGQPHSVAVSTARDYLRQPESGTTRIPANTVIHRGDVVANASGQTVNQIAAAALSTLQPWRWEIRYGWMRIANKPSDAELTLAALPNEIPLTNKWNPTALALTETIPSGATSGTFGLPGTSVLNNYVNGPANAPVIGYHWLFDADVPLLYRSDGSAVQTQAEAIAAVVPGEPIVDCGPENVVEDSGQERSPCKSLFEDFNSGYHAALFGDPNPYGSAVMTRREMWDNLTAGDMMAALTADLYSKGNIRPTEGGRVCIERATPLTTGIEVCYPGKDILKLEDAPYRREDHTTPSGSTYVSFADPAVPVDPSGGDTPCDVRRPAATLGAMADWIAGSSSHSLTVGSTARSTPVSGQVVELHPRSLSSRMPVVNGSFLSSVGGVPIRPAVSMNEMIKRYIDNRAHQMSLNVTQAEIDAIVNHEFRLNEVGYVYVNQANGRVEYSTTPPPWVAAADLNPRNDLRTFRSDSGPVPTASTRVNVKYDHRIHDWLFYCTNYSNTYERNWIELQECSGADNNSCLGNIVAGNNAYGCSYWTCRN